MCAVSGGSVRRVLIVIAAIAWFGPAKAGDYGLIDLGHFGATVVVAQEGHPLTGTWAGDWGATPAERTHITMVMNWDGKAITGLLNPGPDQAPLGSVTLDPPTWTVRIEADTKDASGRQVHISAEGKLEDVASYHRTLSGTWTQGATKGTFKLTRD
jgi:hypothetical protein